MRLKIHPAGFTLWLSRADTATRMGRQPGTRWPCSTMAGHRFRVKYNAAGLCDFTRDGIYDGFNTDGTEFSAQVADALRDRLPRDHPCWHVAVGQFEESRQ